MFDFSALCVKQAFCNGSTRPPAIGPPACMGAGGGAGAAGLRGLRTGARVAIGRPPDLPPELRRGMFEESRQSRQICIEQRNRGNNKILLEGSQWVNDGVFI